MHIFSLMKISHNSITNWNQDVKDVIRLDAKILSYMAQNYLYIIVVKIPKTHDVY